jgi:hypothetical protein
VYSYAGDEDDMVLDPNLASHLAQWGINMMQVRVGTLLMQTSCAVFRFQVRDIGGRESGYPPATLGHPLDARLSATVNSTLLKGSGVCQDDTTVL